MLVGLAVLHSFWLRAFFKRAEVHVRVCKGTKSEGKSLGPWGASSPAVVLEGRHKEEECSIRRYFTLAWRAICEVSY